MIELNQLNSESAEFFRDWQTTEKLATLKWGLVFFFVGIGFIIFDALNIEKPFLLYGIISVGLALGLLTHFFYVNKTK
jgi:hypothetical protein